MFTSSYSLKKTMAQPTIGISQRFLLQLFSVGYIRWIEDTWPLRMYQPSPIRSRKDGVPSFSKNGRISLGERFDRLHALTDLLYISFLSQHFTDNNNIVTMLIAPRTVPHYHPLNKLSQKQAPRSLPSSSLTASYYASKVPSSWSTTSPWFEGTSTGINSSGQTCVTSCTSGMH